MEDLLSRVQARDHFDQGIKDFEEQMQALFDAGRDEAAMELVHDLHKANTTCLLKHCPPEALFSLGVTYKSTISPF